MYEITKVRTISSKEIKGEEASEDLRLAFHLANPKRLYDTFKNVRLSIGYSFAETTLEELCKMSDALLSEKKEPEWAQYNG